MCEKAILSANNLSIGYLRTAYSEGKVLYADLSFDLYESELTCLLGLNGAGKSTLLRTLSGMQPALKGNIYLEDRLIEEYSESDLSSQLGLVLTDKTSVGGLTVSQLVALGRYPYTGFFGRLSKRDHVIVSKAMDDVCIGHKAKNYVAELSDGERQKAMIAKALAQECPVLFLDEPTAFLDVVSRIEIMSLLHNLTSKYKKTILLTTHDIELASLLADRLWLLSREKGMLQGITEDVVMGDAMNQFFARNEVVFDKQSGSFVPMQEMTRNVLLEAEKEEFYWTKNFLRRNGFGLAETSDEAIFKINVFSAHQIEVVMDEGVISFRSFEELLVWIRNFDK